jgi:hypothetical protein
VTNASSPATKIALFRSLFRGRDDVFPKRWENTKTGKAGYAPACANEWTPRICGKPRIKCDECPHSAFLSVTDDVIDGHLRGHHTVGVYPLLMDDTCWFLAVDFDEATWINDATAFLEACAASNIPAALERSRSGYRVTVRGWQSVGKPILRSRWSGLIEQYRLERERSTGARPCISCPEGIYGVGSISRCAFLNAPVGYFPKTSTS